MKKATIIYGPVLCGKTTLAQSIVRENGGSFIYLSASDLPETIISRTIKSIIIDDCPDGFDFESYFNSITSPTETKFIFVTNEKPKNNGASFEARFDLIDRLEYWEDLPF